MPAGWLHRRDPERPVHYAPDFEGRYSDLVSRMYATIEEMEDEIANYEPADDVDERWADRCQGADGLPPGHPC